MCIENTAKMNELVQWNRLISVGIDRRISAIEKIKINPGATFIWARSWNSTNSSVGWALVPPIYL